MFAINNFNESFLKYALSTALISSLVVSEQSVV